MAKLPKRIDRECLKKFLDSFDNVLTDCDGVLWAGDMIIGQAHEALNKLRALGKKVFYVTNNSTKSREEYVEKCRGLGFVAEKEDIISSSFVTAQYLSQLKFNKKVYVIGTSGITKELDEVGISYTGAEPDPLVENPVFRLKDTIQLDPDVAAVVVGFDGHFSFPKIMKAASYLENKDCLFIGTNTDERFPLGKGGLVFPGTGCLVKAVETVAERPPIIMGKPSGLMFTVISTKNNLEPSRTLMIGDRCNTDILFGKNCGLITLVVLSGVTEMEHLEAWAASEDEEQHKLLADYYLPEIGDILTLINENYN
ncbi:glycerol-3-phosphate phosphatase isoform X1 [Macrobrachium rosenbergii]|uniref:glycerol-3-phosphate phosphatase isoform X1 n=2 Tax=Macrobrachium rosenbergii TaxID=79674 RepID=UPI0034D536E2